MQKQRKSDVPPTLSVFLQNKLCYISKRHCSIFLVGLTFGTMVLSICNKQKTADLVTGIVLKPMLRWTPGVFITPGTYHTSKIKYMFCDVKFCARLQIRCDYFHPYMFMYRDIFFFVGHTYELKN